MSPGFIAYLSVCLGIITIAIVAACAVCVIVMLRVRHLAGEVEKVVGAVRAAARPLAVLAGVAAGVSSWVGRFGKTTGRKG